ncbi:hypothetical protein KA183_21380 [bacterium]|nr:hypothetical protein [bacterium]
MKLLYTLVSLRKTVQNLKAYIVGFYTYNKTVLMKAPHSMTRLKNQSGGITTSKKQGLAPLPIRVLLG